MTKDKGRTREGEGKGWQRLWYSFFLKLIIRSPFLSLSPHTPLSRLDSPSPGWGKNIFFRTPLPSNSCCFITEGHKDNAVRSRLQCLAVCQHWAWPRRRESLWDSRTFWDEVFLFGLSSDLIETSMFYLSNLSVKGSSDMTCFFILSKLAKGQRCLRSHKSGLTFLPYLPRHFRFTWLFLLPNTDLFVSPGTLFQFLLSLTRSEH